VSGTRADVALVSRGLFESRAKAQEAIEAGLVFADGVAVKKVSEKIDDEAYIEASAPYPWVSRGGVKLAAALAHYSISVAGKVCLDVGASTGGFSHVLLSAGAAHVVGIEVGHGQLHESLQNEPRLTSLENQDARTLRPEQLPEKPQLIVCDASFISLKNLLPEVLKLAASRAQLVALIKPQFETSRADNKKGIVRSAAVQQKVCDEITAFLQGEGWMCREIIPSPIFGGDGNKEFLICAERS